MSADRPPTLAELRAEEYRGLERKNYADRDPRDECGCGHCCYEDSDDLA